MFIPAMLNTEGRELGAEQPEEISHPEKTPQKEDYEVIIDQGESESEPVAMEDLVTYLL